MRDRLLGERRLNLAYPMDNAIIGITGIDRYLLYVLVIYTISTRKFYRKIPNRIVYK